MSDDWKKWDNIWDNSPYIDFLEYVNGIDANDMELILE